MKKTGRVRHGRYGFTLIELLTVIVIIGFLAVIALPKFVQVRQRSYRSAMQSDLRNLATAQENYFGKNYIYTDQVPNLNMNISENVNLSIPEANAGGWRATATHVNLPGIECEMYYGTVTGGGTATNEGSVGCTDL